MHGRIRATLEELESVEWFRAVGKQDTQVAIVLSSWEEAIAYCSSLDWENLQLEAANRYCEQLLLRDKERFKQWNQVVEIVKPVTEALVVRKIASVVKEYHLPKVFEDTVKWDVLHLAMEAEYADVYPPGFYASQAYWYRQGHFPCGWQGEFPEGMPIIY